MTAKSTASSVCAAGLCAKAVSAQRYGSVNRCGLYSASASAGESTSRESLGGTSCVKSLSISSGGFAGALPTTRFNVYSLRPLPVSRYTVTAYTRATSSYSPTTAKSPANAKGCPRMRTEFSDALYAACREIGTTERASALATHPPPVHSRVASDAREIALARYVAAPTGDIMGPVTTAGTSAYRVRAIVQSRLRRCTYSSHSREENNTRSWFTAPRSCNAMQYGKHEASVNTMSGPLGTSPPRHTAGKGPLVLQSGITQIAASARDSCSNSAARSSVGYRVDGHRMLCTLILLAPHVMYFAVVAT